MRSFVPLLFVFLWLLFGSGCGARPTVKEASSSPRLTDHINARDTLALIQTSDLTQVVAQIDALLLSLPAKIQEDLPLPLRPRARNAWLGFDPATREGWQQVGIDPRAGVAVLIGQAVDLPTPKFYLAVHMTHRERCLAWLRSHELIARFATNEGDQAETLMVDDLAIHLGTSGPITFISPAIEPRDTPHEHRSSFEAFVSYKIPLGGQRQVKNTLGRLSDAHLLKAYFDFAQLRRALGRVEAPRWADLLPPAVGLGWGPKEGLVQIQNAKTTLEGLQQLFTITGPRPSMDQPFMPRERWTVMRLGLNLPFILQGLERFTVGTGLILPRYVRVWLDEFRVRMPYIIGSTLEDVSRTFTGQILVGAEQGTLGSHILDDFSPFASGRLISLPIRPKVNALVLFQLLFKTQMGRTVGVTRFESRPALDLGGVIIAQHPQHVLIGSPETVAMALRHPLVMNAPSSEHTGFITIAGHPDVLKATIHNGPEYDEILSSLMGLPRGFAFDCLVNETGLQINTHGDTVFALIAGVIWQLLHMSPIDDEGTYDGTVRHPETPPGTPSGKMSPSPQPS